MQLVVYVGGLGENAGKTRWELNTFADQDKVAAQIARAVRNWIRVVPVRNSGSRLDLKVTAEWIENVARVPRDVAEDLVKRHMPRPKRKARK
jgi:hypothetical protein